MKNNRLRLITLIAAGGMALASFGAYAESEPEDLIKYRQAVMKAQAGYMGALGLIVKGKVPYDKHAQGHAAALSSLSRLVINLFPEGSDMGETKAKDKLWSDFENFQKAARDSAKAAGALAKVAKKNDMAAIKAAYGDVGKSCKGCHKEYRKKAKK